MNLSFSSRAPTVELRDPLAETLGVLQHDEPFRYTYEDVVKLAGHSCPTVAGAYLMTVTALTSLYSNGSLPVRGDIEVTVGGDPTDGTAGPMSQVITLLTGAAPETGFLGLMGRYRRASLLRFDASLQGRIRFRRIDTGAAVEVSYEPHAVPPQPEMPALLPAALSGRGTDEERERFGKLWQARVEDILTGDPSRVVHLQRLGRSGGRDW